MRHTHTHTQVTRSQWQLGFCPDQFAPIRRPVLRCQHFSNTLIGRFCRADLGWIFYVGPANLRKLPANLSASFDGDFYPQIYRLCVFRTSGPPKKFTPKIHAQKSSAFLSNNFTFSNPKLFHGDFLLTGESKTCLLWCDLWVLQRYHTRPLPSPLPRPLRMPKIIQKKRAQYHPRGRSWWKTYVNINYVWFRFQN